MLFRTPDHENLKKWEHTHEILKDDVEINRDDSENLSEKESEVNESSKKEEKLVEGKDKENAPEGESDDVPQDEDNTRVPGEACRNDVIGAVNGQNEKDQKPTEEGKVDSSSCPAQDDKTTTRNENTDQVSTRLNIDRAREVNDEIRVNNNPARDEKQPALTNDVEARDGEQTTGNPGSTLRNSNLDKEMKTSDNVVQNESNEKQAELTHFNESKIKYEGADKAFMNLLEEIEDDQTSFEEQLAKLEKQVESKYKRPVDVMKTLLSLSTVSEATWTTLAYTAKNEQPVLA